MPSSRALALIALLGLSAPDALAAPASRKGSTTTRPEAVKKRAVKPERLPSAKKAPSRKKRDLPTLAVSAQPRRRPSGEGKAPRQGVERPKGAKVARRARQRQAREPRVDRFPPIRLEAVNTKEKLALRLYDKRGRVIKPSVRKLWHLMRCHLTKLERPINWRLVRQLYRVSRRYPGKTIRIFSGLRARRVSALPNSNHIKGRAVDFQVAGVSNTALRDFLLQSCRPCGVGYYPNGLFVHLDVRERQSAFWVDYSSKGEKSEYASNPYRVLRGEKNGSKARKENGSSAIARKAPPASRPATEDPEPPPEAEAKPEVAKPEEKPAGDSAGPDRAATPPKASRRGGEEPAPEPSGGAPTAGIPRGRSAPAL
jgi:uncharacterized protein YcbK (DUF882 family)